MKSESQHWQQSERCKICQCSFQIRNSQKIENGGAKLARIVCYQFVSSYPVRQLIRAVQNGVLGDWLLAAPARSPGQLSIQYARLSLEFRTKQNSKTDGLNFDETNNFLMTTTRIAFNKRRPSQSATKVQHLENNRSRSKRRCKG